MSTTNPFTIVYESIWEILESNSAFTDLVPARNRIDFTGTSRDPEKRQATTSDYPEVRIDEWNAAPWAFRDSTCSTFTKGYEISVKTGEKRLQDMHNVEWEIWRSFNSWIPTLDSKTWETSGTRFTINCRPLGTEQSLQDRELDRGTRGWSVVWRCEIFMTFVTELLDHS